MYFNIYGIFRFMSMFMVYLQNYSNLYGIVNDIFQCLRCINLQISSKYLWCIYRFLLMFKVYISESRFDHPPIVLVLQSVCSLDGFLTSHLGHDICKNTTHINITHMDNHFPNKIM